jgi:hypothetical protein
VHVQRGQVLGQRQVPELALLGSIL